MPSITSEYQNFKPNLPNQTGEKKVTSLDLTAYQKWKATFKSGTESQPVDKLFGNVGDRTPDKKSQTQPKDADIASGHIDDIVDQAMKDIENATVAGQKAADEKIADEKVKQAARQKEEKKNKLTAEQMKAANPGADWSVAAPTGIVQEAYELNLPFANNLSERIQSQAGGGAPKAWNELFPKNVGQLGLDLKAFKKGFPYCFDKEGNFDKDAERKECDWVEDNLPADSNWDALRKLSPECFENPVPEGHEKYCEQHFERISNEGPSYKVTFEDVTSSPLLGGDMYDEWLKNNPQCADWETDGTPGCKESFDEMSKLAMAANNAEMERVKKEYEESLTQEIKDINNRYAQDNLDCEIGSDAVRNSQRCLDANRQYDRDIQDAKNANALEKEWAINNLECVDGIQDGDCDESSKELMDKINAVYQERSHLNAGEDPLDHLGGARTQQANWEGIYGVDEHGNWLGEATQTYDQFGCEGLSFDECIDTPLPDSDENNTTVNPFDEPDTFDYSKFNSQPNQNTAVDPFNEPDEFDNKGFEAQYHQYTQGWDPKYATDYDPDAWGDEEKAALQDNIVQEFEESSFQYASNWPDKEKAQQALQEWKQNKQNEYPACYDDTSFAYSTPHCMVWRRSFPKD